MIDYVAESLNKYGPLKIDEFYWTWPALSLVGEGWGLGTSCPWRVLGKDGALEFSGANVPAEERLAGLVGLSIVGVAPQGRAMPGDPCFMLSDGRMLEIFSDEPGDPWILRFPDITYVGSPSDPRYFLPGMP